MPTKPPIPTSARALGWSGVLPFAAFAIADVARLPVPITPPAQALTLYGVVILAFMGGAQWGLAMAADVPERERARRLTISVLPALAAFAAFFLPVRYGLGALALGFIALLAYDIAAARAGLAPSWYPALRLQLTAAVVTCLLLAALFGTG